MLWTSEAQPTNTVDIEIRAHFKPILYSFQSLVFLSESEEEQSGNVTVISIELHFKAHISFEMTNCTNL